MGEPLPEVFLIAQDSLCVEGRHVVRQGEVLFRVHGKLERWTQEIFLLCVACGAEVPLADTQ